MDMSAEQAQFEAYGDVQDDTHFGRGPRDVACKREGLIIARHILELSPDGPCLDIGAGQGYISDAAAASGRTAVALDLVPACLDRIRTLNPDIRLVQARAQRLPFSGDSIACAFAYEVFEHML